MQITNEQQRVAELMGLDPLEPKRWPIETIDNLIWIKIIQGEEKMLRQLHQMMSEK